MLWSEKVKSMMAEAVAELQGKICLMQIRVSPFPEVSLVGTVLMFPVVPCGPAHKMQLFPTDSFISTLEIVPPRPSTASRHRLFSVHCHVQHLSAGVKQL